jgi:hypothetical protein
MGDIDIHEYKKRYERFKYNLEQTVKNKEISRRNYEILKAFDTAKPNGILRGISYNTKNATRSESN